MHAVLITFHSTAPLDEVVAAFTGHAPALRASPGLVTLTWLQDGAMLGGFHLFADRPSADAYLDSTLLAEVTANPAFSRFQLAHFGVLEGLSRLTGLPREAAA